MSAEDIEMTDAVPAAPTSSDVVVVNGKRKPSGAQIKKARKEALLTEEEIEDALDQTKHRVHRRKKNLHIHRCRFVDWTPSTITTLAFSHRGKGHGGIPQGLRLAVGRANGDIDIWNPKLEWVHETTLKGGENRSIEGLAWSTADPSSPPRLFSIGFSTYITEWDLQTGRAITNLDCSAGAIWSIVADPHSPRLVVGCDDGSIVVIDISGGPGVMEYARGLSKVEKGRVLSLAWKGKSQIVGGCSDSALRVWDLEAPQGQMRTKMKVETVAGAGATLVWAVKVLHDGTIVSGDSTGAVKFWDKHYSLKQSFRLHDADVLTLAENEAGNSVFSAGVDRKTICYRVVNPTLGKWADVASRRFHEHDVRAMASFDCKTKEFLVSAGVDRSIVVNSMSRFMQTNHRTLPAVGQKSVMAVARKARLMMTWTDRCVKVWKLHKLKTSREGKLAPIVTAPQDEAKLVLKMTFKNEENLIAGTISPDGRWIAVGTVNETKVFRLVPKKGGKSGYAVMKIDVPELKEQGVHLLSFAQTKGSGESEETQSTPRLLIVTPDNEIVGVDMLALEEGAEDAVEELERPPVPAPALQAPVDGEIVRKMPTHTENISHITVSHDGSYFAIVDLAQNITIYSLSKWGSFIQLPRAPAPVTAATFRTGVKDAGPTFMITTADMKILEYDLATAALTEWSRTQAPNLPEDFTILRDKCVGMFFDPADRRTCWLWGAAWLAHIKMDVEMPKPTVRPGQAKRKIDDEQESFHQPQPLTNGKSKKSKKKEVKSVNAQLLERRQYANGDVEMEDSNEGEVDGAVSREEREKPFWITYKYRPMLTVDALAPGEFVVVERPVFDMLESEVARFHRHEYGQ
ncbi:U3 small nucleolar RNA-associated protein [Saitoella coloradoensis]